MAYGTACNRLRKKLLFALAKELGRLTCLRCGEPIKNVGEFSIDHKQPWLDVDPDLFWSLRNVAFSHSSCNSSHGRRPQKTSTKHGTHVMYARKGCRCEACTTAQRRYQRRY